MNIHNNARLTPPRREEMAAAVVKGGLSTTEASLRYGVCVKIVSRLVARFRVEGSAGIGDHSSRPKTIPRQIPLTMPAPGLTSTALVGGWCAAIVQHRLDLTDAAFAAELDATDETPNTNGLRW